MVVASVLGAAEASVLVETTQSGSGKCVGGNTYKVVVAGGNRGKCVCGNRGGVAVVSVLVETEAKLQWQVCL